MRCTKCGSERGPSLIPEALTTVGGLVGGSIAAESAILAGLVFAPLFIMGCIFGLAYICENMPKHCRDCGAKWEG